MAAILRMPEKTQARQKLSVERQEISSLHPVAIAHDIYSSTLTTKNWAPTTSQLLEANDHRLADYIMILAPMIRYGDPDCKIILRGEKIPGKFDPNSSSGRSYSDFLKEETDINPAILLGEVFGSIVTRQILLAETRSPFKNHLSIAMYRGIFPIWNADSNELWAVLTCAPKYVELSPNQERAFGS